MATPAFTIRVFGIYLLGLGAILIVAPGVLLRLFGLPQPEEIWIHVAGMLVAFLGFYYLCAAAAGLSAFFGDCGPARVRGRRATHPGRWCPGPA